MSYFIDMKYINLMGARLEKFAWKRNNLAACRCPICGDSKKNKNKTRFFFFEEKGKFFVKCHNCSYSTSFSKFLEHSGGTLYDEYRTENFMEKFSTGTTANYKEVCKTIAAIEKPVFRVCRDPLGCIKISDLSEDHPARIYIKNRLIPSKHWDVLYYAEDFAATANSNFDCNAPSDARIVIPFYDRNKNLFALQGRALDPNQQVRYITVRDPENDAPKIYGMDRLDETKTNYCFEGPIDSLFIDNSIALAGSSIDFNKFPFKTQHTVFVYDNEPRNREIVNIMRDAIDAGMKTCIWPDDTSSKDVNDMRLAGAEIEQIKNTIDQNTYQGLSAHLRLSKWKRV